MHRLIIPSDLDNRLRLTETQEGINNDEVPSPASDASVAGGVDLLMRKSRPSLWDQASPSLKIASDTGKPRVSLVLAADGATRLANEMVKQYHYLRTPVDVRCSLLAYIVSLGGLPIGCVLFGRPEATRVGGWYGDVAEREVGTCRYTRWEIVNLARLWFDPLVQVGGRWYSRELLPGFEDRRGVFHSQLATHVIALALSCLPIDYLIAYPPVTVSQPYALQECLSYCDPRAHKGTVYRQAGFRLERVNERGLQTFAIGLRSLTAGEDAYIRFLAEHTPRSRRHRAMHAASSMHHQLTWSDVS